MSSKTCRDKRNNNNNNRNHHVISIISICCCYYYCFHVDAWATSSIARTVTSSHVSFMRTHRTLLFVGFLNQGQRKYGHFKSTTQNAGPNPPSLLEDIGTTNQINDSNSNNNSKKYNHDAWKNWFTTCPKEIPPTVMEWNELPNDFPIGTLYRNGHGRFESDDCIKVLHPFDGDGLLSAITFDPIEKRILFRNRFINTYGYDTDKRTGTMSAPGVFGTKASGGFFGNVFRTDFKNVANTHVYYAKHDHILYALWEAGRPYRIDPYTLECNANDTKTNGYDLDGLLKQKDTLAAHYRYDPTSHTMVSFSNTMNSNDGTSVLKLYEFDADTIRPTKPTKTNGISVITNFPIFSHDFVLTKNWCIFSVSPSSLDTKAALTALLGLSSFASVINFQSNDNDDVAPQTSIIMIPRNVDDMMMQNIQDDDRIKVIKVPYHFGFHFANGYEDSDGNVVFDIVQMSKAMLGDSSPKIPIWETVSWDNDLYGATYVRYCIDPDREALMQPPQVIVPNRNTEFPVVPTLLSTKPFRYTYVVGSHQENIPLIHNGPGAGPPGAVIKIDTIQPTNTEMYTFLPHEFVGEVTFIPKVGAQISSPQQEDCGYLVVYVSDCKNMTTDLVIFDAQGSGTISSGPMARITLPTFIPASLHGIFVENLTFDFQ